VNEAESKRLVLLAAIVIAGAQIAKPSLNMFESLWAAGALVIALSAVADVAPQVAGPLALLCALAILTGGGSAALGGVVSKATRKQVTFSGKS
jgi:hypothetical protein